MEVEEIKRLKDEAAVKIRAALKDFTDKTGLCITDIKTQYKTKTIMGSNKPETILSGVDVLLTVNLT